MTGPTREEVEMLRSRTKRALSRARLAARRLAMRAAVTNAIEACILKQGHIDGVWNLAALDIEEIVASVMCATKDIVGTVASPHDDEGIVDYLVDGSRSAHIREAVEGMSANVLEKLAIELDCLFYPDDAEEARAALLAALLGEGK